MAARSESKRVQVTKPGRPAPRQRSAVVPASAERGNYFKEVFDELRKVIWPSWSELSRMTGVVVATVVLLAALIGVVDFVLGGIVQHIYTNTTTGK